VTVAADCDASANLLFVPVRVPIAVATGLRMRALGAGPHTLSCAGAPATIQDFVLTPAEAAVANAQLAEMNQYIRSEADRLGFAHMELESLYGRSDIKPAFNVVQFMTSAEPYGRLVSLDGIHPTAEGHRILATAAAHALNAKYGFGIPTGFLVAMR
jgi:GDSL-like lipase/acylhydrolase family protein